VVANNMTTKESASTGMADARESSRDREQTLQGPKIVS
jgi:hypothetical protein